MTDSIPPRRHSRAALLAMVLAVLVLFLLNVWAIYSWHKGQRIDRERVISISAAEAEPLSDEQIARRLIALWLERYRSSDQQMGLVDYSIEKVEIRSSEAGWISGDMYYSVKPFSGWTEWDLTNGTRDPETGWIHKEFGFEVLRQGERLIFRPVSHHG